MLIWNAHSRMIDALAFCPSGRALALAGHFLACRLIDAATGGRLWSAKSGCTFGLSVAFGRDGSVLCRDGGLSIRAAADGTERQRVGRWCESFDVTPDGRTAFLADGGYQDLIRRYDLTTGATRETPLETGAIKRVAVSPNGRLLALVGRRRFYLLTANRGKIVAEVAERALSNGVLALAFHPNSRVLVFSAGRTLFVWDVVAGREANRVSPDAKSFTDAAFTPDGRRLITTSKGGAARVWDTATWACERSFEWGVGPLRAVAVAPDGTRAAVAGDSGRVVVWDLDA